mmetsp:Transcript_13216/g.37266  ORF Transcript_13216/g.37266 Transcript_13216/m.37266 type:complete len:207 (+) Transcript_13216:1818-2438(+)
MNLVPLYPPYSTIRLSPTCTRVGKSRGCGWFVVSIIVHRQSSFHAFPQASQLHAVSLCRAPIGDKPKAWYTQGAGRCRFWLRHRIQAPQVCLVSVSWTPAPAEYVHSRSNSTSGVESTGSRVEIPHGNWPHPVFIASIQNYGVAQELFLVSQPAMNHHKLCCPLLAVDSNRDMAAARARRWEIAVGAEARAPLHPVARTTLWKWKP